MNKRPYFLRLSNLEYDLNFVISTMTHRDEYKEYIPKLKEASEILAEVIEDFKGDD